MLTLRSAQPGDEQNTWAILEPVICARETYALPVELSRPEAIAWRCAPNHEVFVAELDGHIAGTYFFRPNQLGPGSHVANCGYITAATASGKGVASAMCKHSIEHTISRGFLAIQFNFVVSTIEKAVSLWQCFHFEIVGRLSGAFLHPKLGYVDSYMMYRHF